MKLVQTLSLVSLFIICGCGGSGGGTSKQTQPSRDAGLKFSVHWPERTRLIPEAANSMKFVVTPVDQPDSPFRIERVIERPSTGFVSEVVVGNLPAVFVKVDVTAHPNVDGSGVAQARGSLTAQLLSQQTVHKEVVLDTTVSKVKVEPLSSSTVIDANGSIQMAKDDVVKVLASARDDLDRVVVTARQKWSWLSNAEDIVKVVVTGTRAPDDGVDGVEAELTALTGGNAVITVKEQESGKQFNLSAGVGAVTGSVRLYPLGVSVTGQQNHVSAVGSDARTFLVSEWVGTPKMYRDGTLIRQLTEVVDYHPGLGGGFHGNEDMSMFWLSKTDSSDFFNRTVRVFTDKDGVIANVFEEAGAWNLILTVASGDGKVVFGQLETSSGVSVTGVWNEAGLQQTFPYQDLPITVNYDGSVWVGGGSQTGIPRYMTRNGVRSNLAPPPVTPDHYTDQLSGDGNRLFVMKSTSGQSPRTFTLYKYEDGSWSVAATHDVEFGTGKIDVSFDGSKVLLLHSPYGTPADPVIWNVETGAKTRLEQVFAASGVSYDTGTITALEMNNDGTRVAGTVLVGGASHRFVMEL